MHYEKLLRETEHHEIDTYEKSMTQNIKGLYSDKIIFVNKNIPTNTEKGCVLAEELGHYHTTTGNILDQQQTLNNKLEKQARTWAFEKLVPLSKIINAYDKDIENHHELAEFLGVTEDFLKEALQRYQEIYGLACRVGNVTIYFDPLDIKKSQ